MSIRTFSLSIAAMGFLLIANGVYAGESGSDTEVLNSECSLDSEWTVHSSHHYGLANESIKSDDTITFAKEGGSWGGSVTVKTNGSKQKKNMQDCTKSSSSNAREIRCEYDDDGKMKVLSAEIIRTPNESEKRCEERVPSWLDDSACGKYNCVILWGNHIKAYVDSLRSSGGEAASSVRILSPPSDGEGTGGKK